MPCRKENYIFLEQAVTTGSAEVDALVTKIGEALQLHGGSATGLHVKAPGGSSCLRLRSRGHRGGGGSRASPYGVTGSRDQDWDRVRTRDQDWDQIRPWNKKRIHVEDDPHRLLQELILSGNLIKEAVRRLQVSGDCGQTDGVSC